MYGVPSNLDLEFLLGAELTCVCIGRFDLQFHFVPVGSIQVEGTWELFDAEGAIIDRGSREVVRPPYQVHRLLGRRVVACEVSAPDWFLLRFEDGEILRILDSARDHVSFTIEPGKIVV